MEFFLLLSIRDNKSNPVAAIVAAELSAGRGEGTSGALKSLRDKSVIRELRLPNFHYHGTIPSSGSVFLKYVAIRLDVSKYRSSCVFSYTMLRKSAWSSP